MIRLLARLAMSHCDAQRDFVGHVGGDDFMLLFQSVNWLQRCRDLLADFNRQSRELFDAEARNAGGIWAEDRHGVKRFFHCTTLSIGAVRIAPGHVQHAEEVANLAALAKHEAKLSASGIVCLPASAMQAGRQLWTEAPPPAAPALAALPHGTTQGLAA